MSGGRVKPGPASPILTFFRLWFMEDIIDITDRGRSPVYQITIGGAGGHEDLVLSLELNWTTWEGRQA